MRRKRRDVRACVCVISEEAESAEMGRGIVVWETEERRQENEKW